MSLPFTVKALYEYVSAEPDDLTFEADQIITVTAEEDADWFSGQYEGDDGHQRQGLFPRNYVEPYMQAEQSYDSRASADVQTSDRPVSPEPPESSIEETLPPQSLPIVTAPQPPPPIAAEHKIPEPVLRQDVNKDQPAETESRAPSKLRDRINVFNTSGAAPVAPVKSAQNTNFIKKTFVAPPPSRDAYVPLPPRQPAPAGKLATSTAKAPEPTVEESEPAEEQPRPTSLKERIALLQQRQMEQAVRDKPSPKQIPRSSKSPLAGPVEGSTLERVSTGDISVGDLPGASLGTNNAPVTADQEEEVLQIESPSTNVVPPANDPEIASKDEVDPEVQRKIDLRNRMAKMSGGMGMTGMFGLGLPKTSSGKIITPVPLEAETTHASPGSEAPIPVMAPIMSPGGTSDADTPHASPGSGVPVMLPKGSGPSEAETPPYFEVPVMAEIILPERPRYDADVEEDPASPPAIPMHSRPIPPPRTTSGPEEKGKCCNFTVPADGRIRHCPE